MNYQETLDYLFSQLPMFHRIGAAAYKADLSTTISLCKILKNPEKKFPSIHIAGTNGKGSTSNLLAAVLQESGLKTGLFTSPHLKDFRERIRVNGVMIPERSVIEFVEKYRPEYEPLQPSFFELTFGMAMDYFASENVDIAVVEVGMGGRLDSTNLVSPIVSVITNIGFDHMQFLGNTLGEIAIEKAGIMKQGVPVIIGETQPQLSGLFKEHSITQKTHCRFADHQFSLKKINKNDEMTGISFDLYQGKNLYIQNLHCSLGGKYQIKNIKTVMSVISELIRQGYSISEEQIRNGFRDVRKLTGFSGRWQILNKTPLVICDTGHNPAGLKYVIQQISETKKKTLHFVLGVVEDKDLNTLLGMLPKNAIYYFCKPNIPRGLNQSILMEKSLKSGLKGDSSESVTLALKGALKAAESDDMIFVGGSTFVVAEIIDFFDHQATIWH